MLAPLVGKLAPVFRTDFVRRTWIVTQDGARIEAAIDTGTITAPASAKQERIQELELEWLDGDAAHAADALRAFAARLAALACRGHWCFPRRSRRATRRRLRPGSAGLLPVSSAMQPCIRRSR
ncbi:hypothetical protein D3C81_2004510 [compost metagenome]